MSAFGGEADASAQPAKLLAHLRKQIGLKKVQTAPSGLVETISASRFRSNRAYPGTNAIWETCVFIWSLAKDISHASRFKNTPLW